jgi:phosphomannomutase/phosphoglucomutase
MIYKIILESRKLLSKLIAELPEYHLVKDRIPCPDSIKSRVTEELQNLPRKGKVLDIDGIKVWIPPKSWILIRPSGTEPIFRLMAEAPTKAQAIRIVNSYKAKLSRIIKSCMKIA